MHLEGSIGVLHMNVSVVPGSRGVLEVVVIVVKVSSLVHSSLDVECTFTGRSQRTWRSSLSMHSLLLPCRHHVVVQRVEAQVLQCEVLSERSGPAPSFIPLHIVARARSRRLRGILVLVRRPHLVGLLTIEVLKSLTVVVQTIVHCLHLWLISSTPSQLAFVHNLMLELSINLAIEDGQMVVRAPALLTVPSEHDLMQSSRLAVSFSLIVHKVVRFSVACLVSSERLPVAMPCVRLSLLSFLVLIGRVHIDDVVVGVLQQESPVFRLHEGALQEHLHVAHVLDDAQDVSLLGQPLLAEPVELGYSGLSEAAPPFQALRIRAAAAAEHVPEGQHDPVVAAHELAPLGAPQPDHLVLLNLVPHIRPLALFKLAYLLLHMVSARRAPLPILRLRSLAVPLVPSCASLLLVAVLL